MHPEVIKISRIPLRAICFFSARHLQICPKEYFSKTELSYISLQHKKEKTGLFLFKPARSLAFIQINKGGKGSV